MEPAIGCDTQSLSSISQSQLKKICSFAKSIFFNSEIERDHSTGGIAVKPLLWRSAQQSVTEEIVTANPEEKITVEKQDKKEQKEVNDLQERIGFRKSQFGKKSSDQKDDSDDAKKAS